MSGVVRVKQGVVWMCPNRYYDVVLGNISEHAKGKELVKRLEESVPPYVRLLDYEELTVAQKGDFDNSLRQALEDLRLQYSPSESDGIDDQKEIINWMSELVDLVQGKDV